MHVDRHRTQRVTRRRDDGTADPDRARGRARSRCGPPTCDHGDFSYTATGVRRTGVSRAARSTDAAVYPGERAPPNFDPAPGFTATYTTVCQHRDLTASRPRIEIPSSPAYRGSSSTACTRVGCRTVRSAARTTTGRRDVADQQSVLLVRPPNGDPTDLPLDGSTQTIGSHDMERRRACDADHPSARQRRDAVPRALRRRFGHLLRPPGWPGADLRDLHDDPRRRE